MNDQRVREHAKRSFIAKESVRIGRKIFLLMLLRLNNPKSFSRTLPVVNRLLRSFRSSGCSLVDYLNKHPGSIDILDSISIDEVLNASKLLIGKHSLRNSLLRGYLGRKRKGEILFCTRAKFLYTLHNPCRKNLITVDCTEARELLHVQLSCLLAYHMIGGQSKLSGSWDRPFNILDLRIFNFLFKNYMKAFIKRQLGQFFKKLNQLVRGLALGRVLPYYKPLKKSFLSERFGLSDLRKCKSRLVDFRKFDSFEPDFSDHSEEQRYYSDSNDSYQYYDDSSSSEGFYDPWY
jgi:hypothetical protein